MKRNHSFKSESPKKHMKKDDWKSKISEIHMHEKVSAKSNSALPRKNLGTGPMQTDPVLKQDSSEQEFHLEQTKKRSTFRIEQGRPTPFDRLLQISMIYSSEIVIPATETAPEEIEKPYVLIEPLNLTELEALKSSILLQISLEKSAEIKEYWEDLLNICEYYLENQHSLFTEEIKNILNNKDIPALNTLKTQIINNLLNSNLESNYWKEVLSNIELYKSRLSLNAHYKKFLQSTEKKTLSSLQANNLSIQNFFFRNEEPKINFGDGSDSPLLIPHDETIDSSFEILTSEEDQMNSLRTRTEILTKELDLLIKSQSRLSIKSSPLLLHDNKLLDVSDVDKIVNGNLEQSVDEMIKIALAKKMPLDRDESEFNEIANIKPVMEDWMKKYRPRKPKFFNRIKTGYEWNRHNQTHYDHKNPPPKVVQGYKFNVFYPFLIDKSKAPQFYLQPDETNDTCIIRFHSGPPYEDIAFKIVNREWDFSDRNGFKCFFDKGVLHLYFNFKRHRYKR